MVDGLHQLVHCYKENGNLRIHRTSAIQKAWLSVYAYIPSL